MARRLSTWMVLAVASATLAAGCGSSGPGNGGTGTSGAISSGSASGSAAGPPTSGAPGGASGEHKVGDTVDGGDLARSMLAAMTAARTGRYTQVIGSTTSSGTFVFRADGGLDQEIDTGAGMVIRIVGKDVYLSGGPSQRTMWVKVDPNTTDPIQKAYLTAAQKGAAAQQAVDLLNGSDAKVTEVSADSTTYELTVDAAKLVTPDPAASALPTTMSTMVYVIDSQGRPRTVTSTSGSISSRLTYSDWGADLKVVPPPTDQTGPA